MAGPVSVGVFGAPENLKRKLIGILGGKIKDSKQLSPTKREAIFEKLLELKKEGKVDFAVSHVSNKIIDKIGISKSVSRAISNSLKKLHHTSKYNGSHCIVRLDGLLKAPKEYKNQKTIIGGDAKDVFIACASIVAKVTRDRIMKKLAPKYPSYGFEVHKGYGTAAHLKLIKEIGFCDLHRRSFCTRLPIGTNTV